VKNPKPLRLQAGIFVQRRAHIFFVFGLFTFIGLMSRAIYVHLVPKQQLETIAKSQYQTKHKTGRYRGLILDRNKQPLAMSVRVPSFFVNPKVFKPTSQQESVIRKHLAIAQSDLDRIKTRDTYFAWLKRKTTHEVASIIKAEKIAGLYITLEPSRFYPGGFAAGQLIGSVGMDDQGLFGLEQQYESLLAGEALEISQERDARGHLLFKEKSSSAPEITGGNLELTLDHVIQEFAEEALIEGIKRADAKGGFLIAMDPHTGAVLAVANAPRFNPNLKPSSMEATKNQAIVNAFEAGSVVKPLVAALALDKGIIKRSDHFDVGTGSLRIGKHSFHDVHRPKNPEMSLDDILIRSSNVGIYRVAQKLGKENLHKGLLKFGVGSQKINIPGESRGWIKDPSTWPEIMFANIAFGQGYMTTALELCSSYAALANGGFKVKPYIIEQMSYPDGRSVKRQIEKSRILKSTTAETMKQILRLSLGEGSHRALPAPYSAAGKTGTPQKVEDGRYSKEKHYSTIIGFAPADNPYVLVYIQLDEPNQKHSYGSLWAAPVFKDFLTPTLRYLHAPIVRDAVASPIETLNNPLY
jgi:cell division protein FtsI (penicillin-binding protein 3)